MGVNYNFSTMKWGCWSKQLEVGFSLSIDTSFSWYLENCEIVPISYVLLWRIL